MEIEDKESYPEEPFTADGRYSYADYLTWKIEERVELIKGKVYKMGAAPRRIHQEILVSIGAQLFNFLESKPIKVYCAPFDVRLPYHSIRDEDVDTVVQPDVCVIGDPNKLDDAGCIGAPDLVVEILAPGNNSKEVLIKYDLYKEHGIKEYWIIHPAEQTLLIYTLTDGKYIASKLFTSGEVVASGCVEGFQLDLEEVFKNLD